MGGPRCIASDIWVAIDPQTSEAMAMAPEMEDEPEQQWVAEVRVDDQAGAEPEEDCDGDHGRASISSR